MPPKNDSMIEVLEVDQWTSTADVHEFDFYTVTLMDLISHDANTAKIIFGGHLERKTVKKTDSPFIGTVWFTKNHDGRCKLYKTNYDSSD